MRIIKRSGEEVTFDKSKIEVAIEKANRSADAMDRLPKERVKLAAMVVEEQCKKLGHIPNVEEVQNMVIKELMRAGAYNLAQSYIIYRFQHNQMRGNTTDAEILSIVNGTNEELRTENANKNVAIASTQRDYMAGQTSRDISRRLLLPEDIVMAHDDGRIHFHDMDFFAQRIHNCFSSRTKFVTNNGVIAFSDCYDGQKVVVLDKDGQWRDAVVHKYGKQKLYNVTIHSARSKKVIVCTKDHRWILSDGTVTTNLSVGDSLYALHELSNSNRQMDQRDAKMFAFGFVLGDGVDIKRGLQIRLCGHKIEYKDLFIKADYRYSEVDGKDLVFTKMCDLSKQDFLDKSVWKYLSSHDKEMLFRGLYAADGSRDRNQICTSDARMLAMIQDISAIAGYHISSIKVIEHDTNFKTGAILYRVNFRTRQYLNNLWKVEKIEPHHRGTLEQDVWCVEEPITHSFTLDGGVVTGNCCLVELDDMLQNGTVITDTMIEKPHSFSCAANIATQVIAQVASNQHGGQTITLTHLAPFVDVSRKAIRKEVEEELSMTGLNKGAENYEKVLDAVVRKRLQKEIEKGIQTIQYQILTIMTTNGQTPFISICCYLGEAGDDQRLKDDLAMLIEELFKQRIQGVKNRAGVWVTPAFPKLLYVLEEDNIHPDSPYWYLTELAAKCTAKRMVPDYISEKQMKRLKIDANGNGQAYPCMGCRSFLTPYVDEKGKPKYYGRFNQGVVTINLPYAALSSQGDKSEFWRIFDETLELCHRALRIRHERLLGTPSDIAPILWQHGALARLNPGEPIDKLLYGGYSTISLGYAGLYEAVYYMTGHSHTEPEGKPFAKQIMQYMNDKCSQWREEENIAYSLYGTPIESATYRFSKLLQKKFGIIEGVTDHGYITNSYHVNVREEIDAFTKLDFESEFQALSPGGAISYIEVPNMQDNIPAVLTIIQYIYDHIMYAELNTKSDYCQVCGYDGEIKIVEEDGKLIWECPKCGNRDQHKMNVARRTCGYIGTQFWNQGRTEEIKDRVLHVSISALDK